MQIQSFNSVNFGKMGKAGKDFGRNSRKLLKNPYGDKVKKIVDRYEKEVNLLYNSFNGSRTDADKEIDVLNNFFLESIAMLERKRSIRGKTFLEY